MHKDGHFQIYTNLKFFRSISKLLIPVIENMLIKSTYDAEKEMATHSSALAWRIPGTGEPGGMPSMGSHRVGDTTELT